MGTLWKRKNKHERFRTARQSRVRPYPSRLVPMGSSRPTEQHHQPPSTVQKGSTPGREVDSASLGGRPPPWKATWGRDRRRVPPCCRCRSARPSDTPRRRAHLSRARTSWPEPTNTHTSSPFALPLSLLPVVLPLSAFPSHAIPMILMVLDTVCRCGAWNERQAHLVSPTQRTVSAPRPVAPASGRRYTPSTPFSESAVLLLLRVRASSDT